MKQACKAAGLCWLVGLAFWYVVLVQVSRGLFDAPLGLGGALYPVFFSLPVFAAVFLYELALERALPERASSLGWRLALPLCVVLLMLVILCPMDSELSYLGWVWARTHG